MTKDEFEQIAKANVSDEAYADIEYVYTWHPAIGDVGGKEQIAAIFNAGGMALIRAMKEVASLAAVVERELKEANRKVDELNERLGYLKNGDIGFERCLDNFRRLRGMTVTREMFEVFESVLKKAYGRETTEKAWRYFEKRELQ